MRKGQKAEQKRAVAVTEQKQAEYEPPEYGRLFSFIDKGEKDMKKTLEINGEVFEQGKPIKGENVRLVKRVCTLDDCYINPSQAKRNIYAYWRKWAHDSELNDGLKWLEFDSMWIDSYNCFQFSLSIVLKDVFGYYAYLLHITKSHQIAYKVL